jgi:hypothetical protein
MQSPLKPVASSDDPRVIVDQITDKCRYRVAKTPNGYLITARTRDMVGLTLILEWLHKSEESAMACAVAVMAGDRLWDAMMAPKSDAALPAYEAAMLAYETAVADHNEVCDRLDDRPLIGREVRELRESLMPDD